MTDLLAIARALDGNDIPCREVLRTVVGHISVHHEKWARVALKGLPCHRCVLGRTCALANVVGRSRGY